MVRAVTTADTRNLARRLKAIRDPRMRMVAMARYLSTEGYDHVVEVLHHLVETSLTHSDPAYGGAADALIAALQDPDLLGYDVRAELYTSAKAAGYSEVARLFFGATPHATLDRKTLEAMEPERQVVPRGRTLTLGERKSLARSHRREMLIHILTDPHPAVVTVLLDNPHITESDVVTMAARRPCPPESLETICMHSRWRVRYAIRRALVLNPHTPALAAIRLTTTLRRSDLQHVARDSGLNQEVRDQAEELLKLLL